MALRVFLVVPAIVYALLGLGLLFAPKATMGPYAISLDGNAIIMSRVAGAPLSAWRSSSGSPATAAPHRRSRAFSMAAARPT